MSDTILVWQNNESIIFSHNVFFKTFVKPKLSFNYDELICETPTNVYLKTLDNNQFLLTESEINECKNYCDDFYNSGDYYVYAYDKNDNNLYKGYILKSECTKNNYGYTSDKKPENEACAWDESQNNWKYFYAAITEDGYLYTNIDSINCDKCVLFLTKEEFDKLPKREHDTDSWDFISETWVDKRDIEKLKKETILELRNLFEGVRWKSIGKYVPQYEQETWSIQLAEAESYKNNKDAFTPYIDAYLSVTEDTITKDGLVNTIIEDNVYYVQQMAKVNAKQQNYIVLINNASDGYTIDSIKKDFNSYVNEVLSK